MVAASGQVAEVESVSSNLVRIGKKPTMNYVIARMTLVNRGLDEIALRARGRAITNAVDTVELIRRAFLRGLQVKSIVTGSEEVTRQDGKKASISTIEILISKQ